MGKTRNDCLITEHSVAHPESSSPRTLERCRARRIGPPYVSCRNRVHELRSNLDDPIAEDERLGAAGSEGECGRDGHKIQGGENKF